MPSPEPGTDIHDFGAQDRPLCPRCKMPMRVMSRERDADVSKEYEKQTLVCAACGHLQSRTVNAHGDLHR